MGLSSALVERGHKVELWQTHQWSEESKSLQEYLRDNGVKLVAVPANSKWPRPAGLKALATREVDVVQFHSVFNLFNNQLSSYLQAPYTVMPHSGYFPISLARRSFRKRVFKKVYEFAYLRRSALLIALTEIESREIRNFGYDGPIAVVPNGIELPRSRPEPLFFRARLGIRPDAPLALYVGRLDCHQKRVDQLIRAVAESTGWHLAVVSSGSRARDGRELRKLADLVENYEIGDRVKFVGPLHREEIGNAYEAATIFTLISRWEGLPMTLLEALSFGLPAVVSGEVELVLGVAAANAGWTTDAATLGAMLTRLQDVPAETLLQKGAAGRKLAGRYSIERMVERYEEAIASMLHHQPTSLPAYH